MPPARDIPGFYYDRDKKKYFKIQPNHAGPAGSQYTSDGVKRRKQIFEAVEEEAWQTSRQKDRVQRAPISDRAVFAGGILAREHGVATVTSSGRAAAQTLVNGWSSTEILSSEDDLEERYVPPMLNPSSVSMQGFVFDAATHDLYHDGYSEARQNCSLEVERETVRPAPVANTPNLNIRYLRNASTRLHTLGSPELKRIDLEPSSRTLLTAWMGPGRGPDVIIFPLLDPRHCEDFEYDFIGTGQLFDVSSWYNPSSEYSEILATCPAPPSSEYLFGFCSHQRIHIIDKQIQPSLIYKSEGSSILALDFLENQLLISGKRSGKVQLHDMRTQKPTPLIWHPSSVHRVKQVNTHTVVIAGLQSTLCNYDLRFCKTEPRSKSWPTLSKGARNQDTAKYTMPFVTYPAYKNDVCLDMGFDVDREDGLVAAVVEKLQLGVPLESDLVNVFSSRTGELLRTLDPENDGSTRDTARARALRFVPYRGAGMPKSLWVAKGTKMISYDW